MIKARGVKLRMEVSFKKSDGTEFADDVEDAGHVDNLFDSMWQDVDVTFGIRVLDPSNHLYHYKAFMKKMLTWTESDVLRLGRSQGAFDVRDNRNDMNSVLATKAASGKTAKPLRLRVERRFLHGNSSQSFWLEGPLMAKPFDTDFLLPPNIPLSITVSRTNPDLIAMYGSSAARYLPVIEKMRLAVTYVRAAPNTYSNKLAEIMDKGLIFPVKRWQIMSTSTSY